MRERGREGGRSARSQRCHHPHRVGAARLKERAANRSFHRLVVCRQAFEEGDAYKSVTNIEQDKNMAALKHYGFIGKEKEKVYDSDDDIYEEGFGGRLGGGADGALENDEEEEEEEEEEYNEDGALCLD